MLTIYEQIQRVVDLIEADLSTGITARAAARSAGMSLRSLHQYFPALTGYRFGEYSRRRRLAEAVDALRATDVSILAIALDFGYDSHEAFSRAFKNEFAMTPRECRDDGISAPRIGKVDLVGEVNMGVLTRTLPRMSVAYFDGFKPDPEYKAQQLMEAWMEGHPDALGAHRIFGHNIDANGNLAHDPDNYGYRVMVTVVEDGPPLGDDTSLATIEPGTFVVTGIEGSFEENPSWSWVTEGWRRLQEMVKRNGLQVHSSGRWFEEVLEPVEPGNTRFDLYLEIS